MRGEDGQEFASECSCKYRQKSRRDSMRFFASIPDAYRDSRLYDFDLDVYQSERSRETVKNAFDLVKCWYSDFAEMRKKGMGLYICSRAKGSGKTRLAVSIANEFLKDSSVSVKFAATLQIFEEFKKSWGKDAEVRESDLSLELMNVDVLILDDFGTEVSGNAWMKERLYSIINARYVENKIMIFTSNHYLSELQELGFDERILDRIREKTYRIVFPE